MKIWCSRKRFTQEHVMIDCRKYTRPHWNETPCIEHPFHARKTTHFFLHISWEFIVCFTKDAQQCVDYNYKVKAAFFYLMHLSLDETVNNKKKHYKMTKQLAKWNMVDIFLPLYIPPWWCQTKPLELPSNGGHALR